MSYYFCFGQDICPIALLMDVSPCHFANNIFWFVLLALCKKTNQVEYIWRFLAKKNVLLIYFVLDKCPITFALARTFVLLHLSWMWAPASE